MAQRILLTTVLTAAIAMSTLAQAIETEHGPVEFVNLNSYTPQALLDTLRVLEPDKPIAACAATLRRQLGFADAAVVIYPAEGGKPYVIITVVESADASRIQYLPLPVNDTTGAVGQWDKALETLGKQPWLLDAAVQNYGYVLDGNPDSARTALSNWGLEPEQVEPLWTLLQEHDSEADRDLALWALTATEDYRSRMLAAAILTNFSDSDLVWWRLTDALRDPDARVSSAAMAALHTLVKHRLRDVNWEPAVASLRHVLSGTNLFAFFPTLDLLTKTGLSPTLSADILDAGAQDLLRAYLQAEHEWSQERVKDFLTHLSGQQHEQADEWVEWLDGLHSEE